MKFETKVVICLLTNFYLLMRAGFNMTESGETFCCPVRAGILLSISNSARSNGVAPFKLSLAVELI